MGEKKVKLNEKLFNEKGELYNFSFFCFDYFYKVNKGKLKGNKILIKRVKDSNTITKKSYEYLITFSVLTDSLPVIVADNYNIKNKLKDEHVYFFKNVPMMNEKSFLELLNKGKLDFIHWYKSYESEGIEVFGKELKEELKKEFENIKKEIKEDIISIRKLIDYYFKNKDIFIKETKRFEFKKEKKIIDFSNLNDKGIVFISHFHSKPIIKDEFLIFPKKEIKSFDDLTKIIDEFFQP